jgi:hypothetical protein
MYRTIYDTSTGKIIKCLRLNDAAVQRMCSENPNWAYLNRATDSTGKRRVNLQTLELELIPPEQFSVANLIRDKRRLLLQLCDWTQALDSPLSENKRAEWAAYRQALRDLPDEQGGVNSIDEVVWPTPPQ